MSAPETIDWGIAIPVKGGPDAKSRLRSPARQAIARAVGLDTITAAVAAVGAGSVVVVTADTDLAAEVRSSLRVVVVPDPGTGLDGAVTVAVAALATSGRTGIAVLLGDHPCVTPTEVGAALEVSGRHTHAFVPDTEGTGTAVVTTRSPSELRTAFGAGSAARHEALGLTRLDLDLPGLRLDLDDLDDLEAARALGLGPHTRTALLDYASGRASEHPHGR